MSKDSQERRRFTRVRFDADCLLQAGDEQWQARLVDICLKGALVESDARITLQPGEAAQLQIPLDQESACIVMPVRLNHRIGRYTGFEAQQLELASISHLRRLVELNLGDAALLERELEHLFMQPDKS